MLVNMKQNELSWIAIVQMANQCFKKNEDLRLDSNGQVFLLITGLTLILKNSYYVAVYF